MQPDLPNSQENTHQNQPIRIQGQLVPQPQIQQTASDVSVGKQDVGVKAWVDSTPSQIASTAFLITGLISFLLAGNQISELNFESAFFLFGVSLTCFFGSVVVAAHAVEKAIKEQKIN